MGRQEKCEMTDKQLVLWYWTQHMMRKKEEGEGMNLSLIQRPKRVSASSDTLYIYAPSVLMEDGKLKAKTIIKVLEVHDGDTPEETTLKVMENDVWKEHCGYKWVITDDKCKIAMAKQGEYDGVERPKCVCEGPIEDMPEVMKNATHFVLLSDIGK